MPRVEATLSTAFQFTAPSALRKMLDLKPGDKVIIDTDKTPITIEKAETREEQVKRALAALDEWREGLPVETKKKIKQYAGWTANQHRELIDNLPETKAYMKEKYGV